MKGIVLLLLVALAVAMASVVVSFWKQQQELVQLVAPTDKPGGNALAAVTANSSTVPPPPTVVVLPNHTAPVPFPQLDVDCNNQRPPEHHTFVLWDPKLWSTHESFLANSVLVTVVDTFVVEENHKSWCLSIYGSEENAKYHGYCHPNGNPKVVVVQDRNPMYGEFKAPGARQVLNLNIYEMKQKMRAMAKNGWKSVHSSNNVEETHLVLRPLGRNYGPPPPQFGDIQKMFDVLDRHECFKYVVLRSHEEVSQGSISKDVDILVNDFFMFKSITGARSRHELKMREVDNGPNIQNVVNDKWSFDVRYVGDGYYDSRWQRDALDHRVFEKGVWVQEPHSYAMSLLYHYNVHKPTSQVTPQRWDVIHRQLPLLEDTRSWRSRTVLHTYMASHNYKLTKPHDSVVGHHQFESMHSISLTKYDVMNCAYLTAQTPIGKVIVKPEPKSWNVKCGKESSPFPQFCDRPHGEWIAFEASTYLNIPGVPISIARTLPSAPINNALTNSSSCKNLPKEFEQFESLYEGDSESFYSIQLIMDNLLPYNPKHKDAHSFVHVGIFDYILDNCDRFGYFDKWDMQLKSTKYHSANWGRNSQGQFVLFDNGKAMNCHGTDSLFAARKSVYRFFNGWCTFPPGLHLNGLASFLASQLQLPNAFIDGKAFRGLQWREQALSEYITTCNSTQGHKQ